MTRAEFVAERIGLPGNLYPLILKAIEDSLNEWDNLPENRRAVLSWSIQDIYDKAESMNLQLEEEDALEILSQLDHHADAEQGINWMHVEFEIKEWVDRQNWLPEGDEQDGN